MTESKSWYQSKAIWANIGAVLSAILALVAYELGWGEQRVALVFAIVTAALGVSGRFVATKKIKRKPRGTTVLLSIVLGLSLGGCVGMSTDVRKVLVASTMRSGDAIYCLSECLKAPHPDTEQCAQECALTHGFGLGFDLLTILGEAVLSGARAVELPVTDVVIESRDRLSADPDGYRCTAPE